MEDTSIKELLGYFLSKLWIFIVFTTLALVLGAVYDWEFKTPKYKSSTTLVLTRLQEESANDLTQTDLQLNRSLVSSYREIIKSKRILNQVITDLNLNYSYEELSKLIEVGTVKDTELIEISVITKKGKESKTIANKVSEIFSEEIVDLYNIQNVKIVDEAEESDKPYNINLEKDVLIFGASGAVLAIGLILIMFYFDTRIKTVEEVETKIGLPILGTVPVKSDNDEGGKK